VKVFAPASIVAGAAESTATEETAPEQGSNGSRVDNPTDLTLAAIND
jgi:hypothetical protein